VEIGSLDAALGLVSFETLTDAWGKLGKWSAYPSRLSALPVVEGEFTPAAEHRLSI